MARLRIATRGSALAVAQSSLVARAIERALGVETELVRIKTSGDRMPNVSLAGVGGKGLFVKELEEALLEGGADLAVHSAKDLPARLAPGLALAALPERGDPRDALVGSTFEALRPGARVGTGSLRRGAQLRAARPDLAIEPLRGNVDTRLRKLAEEGLDAVVLACAGLDRLGLASHIAERLSPARLLPAVAQGTLALEAREGTALAADLGALDHAPTRAATRAERAFLERLAGDCNVPLAAWARVEGERIALDALLASPDGSKLLRAAESAPLAEPEAAGRAAADAILAAGGDAVLAALAPGGARP
ncbi:MAG TPA: hydroxymethylbilane synthase [Myxococcota bacterium]|nr:hydroxymethylbilane synthase [Myxococcota bacterium]